MKIALGGIAIESCTFSPLLSRAEDFTVLSGKPLLDSYPFLAGTPDVTLVPLLYARAMPGGPVDKPFYDRVKADFITKLKENTPYDGIFLHMHGAVFVDKMEDAEGDFLSAIREVVGKDCLIAASYDLHGNVSPAVMRQVDILSAYRTAPHVDWYQTLERVYGMLVRCLRENLRPYKAYIPVPVLLPGEMTSTEWEPAGSLYQKIPGVIQPDAVMDASIVIGYVWADEPRSTGAVVALGLDKTQVDRAAVSLAEQFWAVRHQFQFGVPAASVDDCIRMAVQSKERPVVISDAGDNPTAGAAGDTPILLERMLALGVKDAVIAGIVDPEALLKCVNAGVGSKVDLSLGGKLDPVHATPLSVNGQVISLHAIPWTPGGMIEAGMLNRIAVVDVKGITVVVTELRKVFHRLIDFTQLGIDPYARPIVVVKIGYLEPELKKLASKALLALSAGAVDQDIVHLVYRKIHRPMFPFDPEMSWKPAVHPL